MSKRDYLDFDSPDDAQIRAERNRARDLRKSRWWQQKTASGICHYCGRKVAHSELTMDHLVPLARGGRSTRQNLVPCCKSCNNLKKSMLPLEWEEFSVRSDKG
ncbi:MAG: HNH endonuclease [Desulforhopalus sp.]|jgi:5-methylcytosine-specific restriction endonuclease McrA|nr:HNH endonuclease [Desulforhopalus sp.]